MNTNPLPENHTLDIAYLIDSLMDIDRRKGKIIATLIKMLLQHVEAEEVERIINETIGAK